jgi:hypothetical protein
MPDTIRCPFCIDTHNFKLMTRRVDERWFLCPRCGHVVVPENSLYRCPCSRCIDLRLPSTSPSKAGAGAVTEQPRAVEPHANG